MNLKQLELKRTRELLAACRKARHLAHAMRSPLAKYLRFQKEAVRTWDRATRKLQLVNENTRFETIDQFSTDPIDELSLFAKGWADEEKELLKRIKVLSAKPTTDPKPVHERIAERRAKRKKKTKAQAKAIEKSREARRKLGPLFQEWQKEAWEDRELLALLQRIGSNLDNKYELGFDLSNLRLKGHADWAETIKSLVK